MEQEQNKEQKDEMSMEELKGTSGGKRFLNEEQAKKPQAKETQYGVPEKENVQEENIYIHRRF